MIRLALILALATVTACQLDPAAADSGVPQQANPASLAKVTAGGNYYNIQRGDDFFPFCEVMNYMYVEGEQDGCFASGQQTGCHPDYTCDCCRCNVHVGFISEDEEGDCLSASAAQMFSIAN